MHLIYLDESGNSGNRLDDPQQPIFGLCAMIVPEGQWQSLELQLAAALDRYVPAWRESGRFEVHGSDLRTGHGAFRGFSVERRIALRDEWMEIGERHGVRLIFRSVHKEKYRKWLVGTFGDGIVINPHVAAFALVVRCIENYLRSQPDAPLGILISDENKEIVKDVENSLKLLKNTTGELKLTRIVEKGFFIDSSKSLPLQLCDLFALALRKQSERAIGLASKSIDESAIRIAERLLHLDRKQDADVISWLSSAMRRK